MENNYKVLSNEYLNTGGGCMVNITTVYDKKLKRLQYVYINEENLVVTNYDYICNALPDGLGYEDVVSVVLDRENFTTEPAPDNFSMYTLADELVQLLLNCELHYIRSYCQYNKRQYFTTVDKLPNELYKQVTDDYKKWLDDNNQLIETDGYKIIVDDRYFRELTTDTPNAIAAKKLQQLLNTCMPTADIDDDEKAWYDFYNEKLQIIYCGKLFTFDNGADVYNGLEDFVKFVIDQQ